MPDISTNRCALESELNLDLPALRNLGPDDQADFIDVLRTALYRERRKARGDLDAKLEGRARFTRAVLPAVVLGRGTR